MAKDNTLRYGPPGQNVIHICVDMQRMFADGTQWEMQWLERILPRIVRISAAHCERTIFTRFIPAQKAGQGVWRRYYERWAMMTIDELGADMIDVVPDLARFIPPARTFDKHVYSPWTGTDLHDQLRGAKVGSSLRAVKRTFVCLRR